MNYSTFDIEDFAFDETFQQWVLNEDSPHRPFWESYLATNTHQTDKILAARTLVMELEKVQHARPHPDLAKTIWQNVQHRIQPQPHRWLIGHRYPVWQVAASLALIVGLCASLWWYSQKSDPTQPVATIESVEKGFLEEVNCTGRTVKIHLPDGSVISLAKDSRLSYPQQFDSNQRVVYLVGEAFFEVKKNPNQPFLVYANETVTKVLGTSFRIRAFADDADVTVAVRTGRVSVFTKKDFEQNPSNPQRTGLVLTPNQQAIFSKQQAQLNKTLVEQPVILTAPNQPPAFDFDNTPLSDVFAVLEKAYGVDIVYETDLLANRSLTVSLEDESLYDKLNVICKTIGVSYQIVDGQVIIESKNQKK